MLLLLFSALSLGFAGSFHCVGMCGPIALTLPAQHLQGWLKLAGIVLYNAGRISAYALLGLLFGWLGRQFYLGGLQQWLSITLGYFLFLLGLWQCLGGSRSPAIMPAPLARTIKAVLSTLLHRRKFRTLYAIGFFNGLLPCGLVYLGITGALATGQVLNGAMFMAAFGAGTLPAMITLSWCSQLIGLNVRRRIQRGLPFLMMAMALLLIVRGLNLGIPYLSPATSVHNQAAAISCHKP